MAEDPDPSRVWAQAPDWARNQGARPVSTGICASAPRGTIRSKAAYGAVYDVFVCHASEDKDEVARPLAESLRAEGLEVWFDEFALRIGSSLRRSIDRGLANSRFGVVILSPAFFDKGWSNYELDGLVTREVSGGGQIILPVWHRVTKAEVTGYSPSLADKLARNTADYTVAEIASEISEVIGVARVA